MRQQTNRARTLATIITTIAAACSTPQETPRTVRLCTLNYEEFPAQQEHIDTAIKLAKSIYLRHANIKITETERGTYHHSLDPLYLGQDSHIPNPNNACEQPHDIAAIFTSATNIGGWSSTIAPFITITNFLNKGYNTTLLHELGHQLGARHYTEHYEKWPKNEVMAQKTPNDQEPLTSFKSIEVLANKPLELLPRQQADSVFIQSRR